MNSSHESLFSAHNKLTRTSVASRPQQQRQQPSPAGLSPRGCSHSTSQKPELVHTGSSIGSSLFLLDADERRGALASIPFCFNSQSAALTSDGSENANGRCSAEKCTFNTTSRIHTIFLKKIKLGFRNRYSASNSRFILRQFHV